MAQKRLLKAVVFKGFALSASLLNVVIAGIVLMPGDAFLYLAMLSMTQLMIPFAGFGVAQKLVRLEPDAALHARAARWFILSAAVGLTILGVQSVLNASEHGLVLFLICGVQLIHIVLSERVRSGQARQSGFHIYNIALAAQALGFLYSGGPAMWHLVFPIAALCALIWRERAVFFAKSHDPIRPSLADLRTSTRISAINQYYNIIVVLLSLVSASPSLLALVMMWRFNIFFNWQTFYWLRFGHKDLIGRDPADLRIENHRVNRLNWLACAAACSAAALVTFTPLATFVSGTVFDQNFFRLVAIFAIIRTAINLVFPYELLRIYTADFRSDMRFFGMAGLSFAIIMAGAMADIPVLVLLGITEGLTLVWRLAAKWEGPGSNKDRQTL